MKFWTMGHSTRTIEEFVGALRAHGISLVVDVRKLPGSKRYPHFNQEEMQKSLAEARIRYEWFPELGGRRKANADSRNTAWRNESFGAYADYMETAEFEAAIGRLLSEGANERIAYLCSEAVWWRCHRALISDYLKVRGHEVLHIQDAKKVAEHPYTSAARIVDGELSYRGEAELF
jgi:uncharacterized protein (DUF488 family)